MIIIELFLGMLFFTLLGLVSLVLIPSVLGCMGFVLGWMLFLGVLIFFSINIGWFLLSAGIFYVLLTLAKYWRYVNLPDYTQYRMENNSVVATPEDKVSCKHCGSFHISQRGLFGSRSKLRYYGCLNCRCWLYKFKVL